MATTASVMKVEIESDGCCVCGAAGCDLMSAEEYDVAAGAQTVPLRSAMLHLTHNKVLPEGRFCGDCIRRASEAYEFSTALVSRTAPPLSEKIRALRRRLHDLTQKIDVFIVVGGPGAGAGAYSEDDIIMVEPRALAAATAADDEGLEHAKNARGDTVYQCSVCPLSFQRVGEYREHAASHPEGARHSCWTCGAQFATRAALHEHSAEHAAPELRCNLCATVFADAGELRRHEAGPACPSACPAPGCAALCPSRPALTAHAAQLHGRAAPPPHVCPICFLLLDDTAALSAHLLRHRQAKQFVCGYGDCVLRFATRSNLMVHIRKCHAAELAAEGGEEPAVACPHCDRTFSSAAAMKRHVRVHRHHIEQEPAQDQEPQYLEEGEGEVEYLEVETLEMEPVEEEEHLMDEDVDIKPGLPNFVNS